MNRRHFLMAAADAEASALFTRPRYRAPYIAPKLA